MNLYGYRTNDLVFIQDRRLRADGLIIRAQSMIRADGPPSAQIQVQLFAFAAYGRA